MRGIAVSVGKGLGEDIGVETEKNVGDDMGVEFDGCPDMHAENNGINVKRLIANLMAIMP